jgi:hypothetical protein
MKPWMIYALCVTGGVAGGVVIAKYTLPPKVTEKVVIQTKEIEVVRWKDRVVVEKGPERVTTRTVTVPGPAGPTVTVEKVVEKEKIVTRTVKEGGVDTVIVNRQEASKVTESRPVFALGGVGGMDLSSGRFAFSGDATLRILGPLWLGAGIVKADAWYFGPAVRIEF